MFNKGNLFLQNHHLRRLCAQLLFVTLLVSQERLLLSVIKLLLNPSVLLYITTNREDQTSFSSSNRLAT